MNIWTTIKNWVLGWFVNPKELKVIEILEGVDIFFNKALPIVRQIDEQLKPLLKKANAEKSSELEIYSHVLWFLNQFQDVLDDVLDLVDKVYQLPLPDMLFLIAVEILKAQSKDNPSISVLRLAVELAYNVYKNSKK